MGYGNWLFIRGEGEGLSWESGLPLTCVDANTWVWTLKEAKRPARFKLLLNDQIWAEGEDLTVQPGTTLAVTPTFGL